MQINDKWCCIISRNCVLNSPFTISIYFIHYFEVVSMRNLVYYLVRQTKPKVTIDSPWHPHPFSIWHEGFSHPLRSRCVEKSIHTVNVCIYIYIHIYNVCLDCRLMAELILQAKFGRRSFVSPLQSSTPYHVLRNPQVAKAVPVRNLGRAMFLTAPQRQPGESERLGELDVHLWRETSDIVRLGQLRFCILVVCHMLHVWNIYLHLPQKSPSYVGKYTIHGASGYGLSSRNSMAIHDESLQIDDPQGTIQQISSFHQFPHLWQVLVGWQGAVPYL